ncbi:hypothetical protein F2P81_002933 [Scophthalmus maximus]|uniref:Uncharacterized protein n=1 Tax=Scophthalmus maximus TaxID=52904 RepID=A0A6A4TEX5_SCOMX|nr:hypothetical protein F2P81_002933 [Scophthalmus maximus]
MELILTHTAFGDPLQRCCACASNTVRSEKHSCTVKVYKASTSQRLVDVEAKLTTTGTTRRRRVRLQNQKLQLVMKKMMMKRVH